LPGGLLHVGQNGQCGRYEDVAYTSNAQKRQSKISIKDNKIPRKKLTAANVESHWVLSY